MHHHQETENDTKITTSFASSNSSISRGTIAAVNYCTNSHETLRRKHVAFMKAWKPDEIISLSPGDLAESFSIRNSSTLSQKRGAGFWMWKPQVILQAMKTTSCEYILYCDVSSCPVMTKEKMLDIARSFDHNIMGSRNTNPNSQERMWTKPFTFQALGVSESGPHATSDQRVATMILVRNTTEAHDFIKDWIRYVQIPNVVNDFYASDFQRPKFFRDHRHDQSVFSLLSKSQSIPPICGINQWVKHHIFTNTDDDAKR